MSRSLTIEEDNLSVAWAKAFLHVVDAGEIATLIVVIRGFTDGQPMEVAPIRLLLDDALGTDKKALSCHEVANTIFPISLWNPQPTPLNPQIPIYHSESSGYKRGMSAVLYHQEGWTLEL